MRPFVSNYEICVTNRGIRIDGCLLSYHNPDKILVLKYNPGKSLGIWVRDNGGAFVRTRSHTLADLHGGSGKQTTIYCSTSVTSSNETLSDIAQSQSWFSEGVDIARFGSLPDRLRRSPERYEDNAENDWESANDANHHMSNIDVNWVYMKHNSECAFPDHSTSQISDRSFGQLSWISDNGTVIFSSASPSVCSEGQAVVGMQLDLDALSAMDPETETQLAPDHPFSKVREELVDLALEQFHACVLEGSAFRMATNARNYSGKNDLQALPDLKLQLQVADGCKLGETSQIKFMPVSSLCMSCPFYKKDKVRYFDCLKKADLMTVSDVVHHLWISHKQPPYCPVCYSTFKDMSERNEHIVSRGCTTSDSIMIEGVSAEQMQQIGVLIATSISTVHQWHAIWRCIFPQESPPFSIYNSNELEQLTSALREFWRENGHEIIGMFMNEKHLLDWNSVTEEQDLNTMYLMVLDDLIGRQVSHMSNLILLDTLTRDIPSEVVNPRVKQARTSSTCKRRDNGRKTAISAAAQRSSSYPRDTLKKSRSSRDSTLTSSHKKQRSLHCRMAHT
jgi:hypothetical protein